MIKMNKITPQSSVSAENTETQYQNSSSWSPSAITMFNGKVYDTDGRAWLNDGRVEMPSENFLFDYDAIQRQGNSIVGASGKDQSVKEHLISSRYLQMSETYEKAKPILAESHSSYQRVLGAAGSVTAYETVRRAEDLVDVVGQQYTLEDYTAMNVANVRNVSKVRFTRPRKTSSLVTVQREIGDDQEPEPERQVFTEGTVDIFADAVQHVASMRDNVDTTFNITAEFNKEIAGMFAAEKDAKVIEKINAVTGTNQGDWDAVSGSFYTVNAATQVQVQEDAVKSYGRPLVALFADDAWRGYMDNIRAPLTAEAAGSTSIDLGGIRLPKNPSVTAWVNSDMTAGTYAVIAKPSYIDLFKAMTVQTSFKNVRTPGQADHRFWFDFNGVLENTTSAIGKGTSVLA